MFLRQRVVLFLHFILLTLLTFCFVPGNGAKYWDERVCMSVCFFVCLYVCLSACLSQKPHVQIFYSLSVAVARSSFDRSAITLCILPVLWMTTRFRILKGIGPNQKRRVFFVKFTRWRYRRHQRRRLPSPAASCYLQYCYSRSCVKNIGYNFTWCYGSFPWDITNDIVL